MLRNRELPVQERLKEFAASAGWRIRRIELTQDCYKQSARPVLAFRREDDSPVILYLSANGSSYRDPARGNRKYPLDRKSAPLFAEEAYCFYEPFPPGKKTKKTLLKFVFATAKPVLALIVAAGLISSLIGLVMPVATRYITGEIIPTANLPELWQLMFLLIVLTACEIGLNVVPSLVMMLFSAQQYERFQAAMYDHVLRIPVKTFRMCDSGDMTQRILGASQIQAAVFGIISQQFLSSLFSLVSLAMMFYYSPLLGAMGLVMVLIYASVFFLLSRINLHPLAVQAAAAGRMSGLMKQFFDGMAKIRAAGAEQQILSRFTDDFSEMVRQNYIISRNGAYQSVFSTIFPMLITLVAVFVIGALSKKKVKGAVLWGMLGSAVLYYAIGLITVPEFYATNVAPNLTSDFFGAFKDFGTQAFGKVFTEGFNFSPYIAEHGTGNFIVMFLTTMQDVEGSEVDERCAVVNDDARVLKADEGDEQADASGNGRLDCGGNGVEDHLAQAGDGQQDEDDAVDQNQNQRVCVAQAKAEADRVDKECVQAHAGSQSEGLVGKESHSAHTNGGGQAGSQEHAVPQLLTLSTKAREQVGVQGDDVGHRHERGQARQDLCPDGGSVLLQVKSFLHEYSPSLCNLPRQSGPADWMYHSTLCLRNTDVRISRFCQSAALFFVHNHECAIFSVKTM